MIRQAATLLLLSCVVGCGADAPKTDVAEGEPTFTEGVATSADGVAIHYDVRGTGDPTLVLVHGWTNPRTIWGEHPSTLSSTNRVVALDLAGHGVSGADRLDWTVDAFGEDVVAVVDQLALESVVLVGFSMGAGVVLEAAERLGDRVLGVVLVDDLKDPDWQPNLAEKDYGQFEAAVRERWGDTAFVRAFAFTPDAPDSLITYVTEMMPEQPHEYWFKVLQVYEEWRVSELKPTLRRVEAPIAAINTTTPPTSVEVWRRYVPSFTVDTIAGVGHAGILLQRVGDFDARLLAIVERFASADATGSPENSGRDNLMSQAEQDRRVDYIEFRATSIEETKKFYSEVFGWEFTDYGPDYTSFTDGRMNGGFESAPAVAAGGPLVVLYSTNLEAIEAAVRENGGQIVRETFEFPGGRRFHFTDPSGNELAVWSDR